MVVHWGSLGKRGVDMLGQHMACRRAFGFIRLHDGGQAHQQCGSDAIEAGHGEVFRCRETSIAQDTEHAERHRVGRAQHRGELRARGKQLFRGSARSAGVVDVAGDDGDLGKRGVIKHVEGSEYAVALHVHVCGFDLLARYKAVEALVAQADTKDADVAVPGVDKRVPQA